MEMIVGANGTGHMTLAQLEKKLDKLRKPGRPSREVVELKEKIAALKAEAPTPAAPAKKARGKKSEVVFPVPEKPSLVKKAKGPVKAKEESTKEKPAKKERKVKEAKNTTEITIPSMRRESFVATIAGDYLVFHRLTYNPDAKKAETEAGGLMAVAGQRGKKVVRPPRDPVAEYNAARHLDKNGRDCLRAIAIKKAMIQEWVSVLGLNGIVVKSGVWIRGTLIPIKFSSKKPEMREDMVMIGKFKNIPENRYRPGYENWSADITIDYDASMLTGEQVIELLNRAGGHIGIGEDRPGKSGGNWGTWTVVKITKARPLLKAV